MAEPKRFRVAAALFAAFWGALFVACSGVVTPESGDRSAPTAPAPPPVLTGTGEVMPKPKSASVAKEVRAIEEFHQMTAAQIHALYERDEEAADALIRSRWFHITGVVKDRGEFQGYPTVTLKPNVLCIFDKYNPDHEAPNVDWLPLGTAIEIKGKGLWQKMDSEGRVVFSGEVIFKDCVLVKPSEEELAALIEEAKWRTWTADEYRARLKFVSMTAGVVTLEKEDGSTIEVPLEKLSEEDAEWIRGRGWLDAAKPEE